MAAPTAYPLLWCDNVATILDWAIKSLGLSAAWINATETGDFEHAELRWPGGLVSLNIKRDMYADMGPAGIALRLAANADVDACHARAVKAGANIVLGPEESPVAYSFTAVDPDGNHWWVHAETPMFDELRDPEEEAT